MDARAGLAPQFLGIGEQKSIPVESGTKFSVGNPEVIKVKATQISGGRSILLVKGKSQGFSDLVLIGTNAKPQTISFRVVTKLQRAAAKENESLVSETGQMQMSGGTWLLKGKVKSLEDWNSSKALEEKSGGKIENLLRIHPLERLKAEQEIRRRLKRIGAKDFEVFGVGSSVIVRGNAADTQEKELIEQVSREVFRSVRTDVVVPFERARSLRFHAKILELLNSDAKSLGLDWSNTIPSVIQLGKNFSGANFQFDAALRVLEKRGRARVLSQPQLYLNEKGFAELKVGGEIPIPIKTRAYSNVIWKPFGLMLRLEVPGMSRSKTRAKILVEMSGLDPSNSVEGIPGLRVSKMETTVDLELGRPVLLSGLMESRESRNLSLLPALGDIPVLGELFRSREFQENRSELVIWLEAKNP